jgi:hypothetical protein
MRTWLAIGLLLAGAVLLGGCIGDEAPGDDAETASVETPRDLLPDEEQAWKDPMTQPHPDFAYPTFTTVPEDAPDHWQPIATDGLPDTVAGTEHTARADDVPTGSGIALFGQLAIVSGDPTSIVDISDPANPQTLAQIDVSTRDADTIAYPDGTLVAIFATSSGVLPYYDISDPSDPVQIGSLEPSTTTHNVAVLPGTPIVFNSNSAGASYPNGRTADGADGQTEIYNLSDPEDPEHVADWQNGYGCHDITFWNDPSQDKYRGYCAGIQMTQIWDVADPTNPEVITNVPVHHGNPDLPSTEVPITFFSHLAMTNQDGTVLIVGDETGGGAAPGCDGPGYAGNLWFYDISDETDPQLMGSYSPSPPALTTATDDNAPTCTAHFGRLIPSEDRDLLAMAFYGAGTVVLDFTDPSNPQVVDQFHQGTNTWDAWYYNGYLFTGDISTGLDVLELTGS